MRTPALFLLVVLAPARVFAATPALFLEDDLGELAEQLRVELPETEFAADRASADIAIHFFEDQRLTIVDRLGTLIIDRTLTGTRAAVLRAATLLVVDAITSWEPPAEAEPEPPALPEQAIITEPAPEASAPWTLRAATGFGVAWRWSATEPQLLYTIAVSLAHGDVEGSRCFARMAHVGALHLPTRRRRPHRVRARGRTP
jgi:hypothetical protein